MTLPESVDPRDPISLAKYYESHAIPVKYNAGFIVLSVIVSLIGCYTTLLLIGRRTGNHGWRNLMFLVLAATTTSSVGIWGMHFIGMHLQLKPSEYVTWYVRFAPGFTVFSLFLPLVILCFAFYFLGGQGQVDYTRIIICGVVFGGIVSLMHYSASFQASFKAKYDAVNLFFSIIIACVASSTALLAFFRFRDRWQDTLWKRLLCGFLLAAAISSMHYIALVGTSWKVRNGQYSESWVKNHNSTLAYAIAGMCIALCLLSAALAFYDSIVLKSGRLSGQQLVVASASFTHDGKILVKPDGTIPMQVMGTKSSMREIIRELDIRSETFSWLYSLTWDWAVLEPFLPRIIARTLGLQAMQDVDHAGVESIREAFVLASQGLASELYLPVNSLGVLFDKVVTTSTNVKRTKEAKKHGKGDDRSSTATSVIESGFIRTPAGVMLVLKDRTQARAMLSDKLGVDKDLMGETLEQLRTYARRGIRSVVQPQGVYAALFALRPGQTKDASEEVLVYNFARHQVPAFRLPEVAEMTDEIRDWLKTCQSMTLAEVVQHANTQANIEEQPETLRIFQLSLIRACEAVLEATKVWPNIASLARINTEVVEVPSSSDELGCAYMINFNVLLPEPLMPHERDTAGTIMHLPNVHNSVVSIADGINDKDRPFVFTPLEFFQTAQAMLFQGPRSQMFTQQARVQLASWYPSSLGSSMSPTQEKFGSEDEKSSPMSSRPSFSNPFLSASNNFFTMPASSEQVDFASVATVEKERPHAVSTDSNSSIEDGSKPSHSELEVSDVVTPPRPAKSPRRKSTSRRPAPRTNEPEAEQRPNSGNSARRGSRAARPAPPELDEPAPAYIRPRSSEAGMHNWNVSVLTPREQMRLANLRQSALARQTNDDWVQRATAELGPKSRS